MNFPAVGNKLPTIKPDDLVRTPSGRICICEAINLDGSRALRDVITGEQLDIHPQHLTLVHTAPVRPWPSRKPGKR